MLWLLGSFPLVPFLLSALGARLHQGLTCRMSNIWTMDEGSWDWASSSRSPSFTLSRTRSRKPSREIWRMVSSWPWRTEEAVSGGESSGTCHQLHGVQSTQDGRGLGVCKAWGRGSTAKEFETWPPPFRMKALTQPASIMQRCYIEAGEQGACLSWAPRVLRKKAKRGQQGKQEKRPPPPPHIQGCFFRFIH